MSIIRAAELTLTPEDLNAAGALFGIESMESLGGFENALFRSTAPVGRILRITHTSRRDVSMVEAEFEYMHHLATHGVPVVAPIESASGALVEELDLASGERVVVACMTEAPGRLRRSREWSDTEIMAYGELLGALHLAAEGFSPTHGRRPDWTDPIFDVGFAPAEESDPELFLRVAEIRNRAAAHAAGGTGLLIHQDAHLGNLFITDDGQISLFDFDDCGYGTRTHDVAIVLFYWLMSREDQHDEVRRFVPLFLSGYERHATLPARWPEGADLILSNREIEIYWLIKTDSEAPNPMEAPFMVDRRQRLLDGVPYLGIPLAELL